MWSAMIMNDDPWKMIWGQPYIDATRLAAALEQDLSKTSHPDFRTRLLVRDAARAVQSYWGPRKFAQWLKKSPVAQSLRTILEEDLGEIGFPNIRSRLVTGIEATQVKQIFTILGREVRDRVEVNVAGSIPTLLEGLTVRPTADIDLVDEVPAAIRKQRALLQQIKAEYGLTLGHARSNCLPVHWENRRHFLGDFGGLRVYLVDAYDIFVSKLSSKMKKHQDDLRVLALKLDKDHARKRLLEYGHAFLSDPRIRRAIEVNWQFLFQEPLVLEELAKPIEKPKPGRRESSKEKTRRQRRKPK